MEETLSRNTTLSHYRIVSRLGAGFYWNKLLKENARRRYVSAYSFALVCAGLGEKIEAFQWLEKRYQDRTPCLSTIKVDPLLDNLRSDPRFADLMRGRLPQ